MRPGAALSSQDAEPGNRPLCIGPMFLVSGKKLGVLGSMVVLSWCHQGKARVKNTPTPSCLVMAAEPD